MTGSSLRQEAPGPTVGELEPGSIEWHSIRAIRAALIHTAGSYLWAIGFCLVIWGWLWGAVLLPFGVVLVAGTYLPMRRHVLQGDFDRPVALFEYQSIHRRYPEGYVFLPHRWRRMWLRAGHRESTAWIGPASYLLSNLGVIVAMIGANVGPYA